VNAEQHEAALKRVDELMDAKAGSPEADELRRLADEIVAYENAHILSGDMDLDAFTCTCHDVYGEDRDCKLHHAEAED
jgi:hypothetical protein